MRFVEPISHPFPFFFSSPLVRNFSSALLPSVPALSVSAAAAATSSNLLFISALSPASSQRSTTMEERQESCGPGSRNVAYWYLMISPFPVMIGGALLSTSPTFFDYFSPIERYLFNCFIFWVVYLRRKTARTVTSRLAWVTSAYIVSFWLAQLAFAMDAYNIRRGHFKQSLFVVEASPCLGCYTAASLLVVPTLWLLVTSCREPTPGEGTPTSAETAEEDGILMLEDQQDEEQGEVSNAAYKD